MRSKLYLILGFFMLNAANAAALPDYPFIFESGTARVDVAPDAAIIDITVSSRGSDASKALDLVNASMSDVFKAFNRSKLRKEDVESSDLVRSLDYADPKRNAAPTYTINRHVRVQLRDLSLWAALMSELAKMKNVERLSAEFLVSNRRSIDAELQLKAAHDAEDKADKVAKVFGKKLGSVMAISEAPFNMLGRALTEDMSNDAFSPPPPFSPPPELAAEIRVPTTIAIQKNLNVIFKLE
ncbi:SIMPL domain-containing protein [Undibacterium terreum]|uniref:DUF541 domain-containing protein n=1 Tax=Undibacterium terreum TaxID=1224302 RepID=A0A916XDU7_9BURK|nr:SIMPL domain-containing protein [Undibacterium terreum]GGC64486.1 hypothetical protein GCM10011396_09320 [Undibacterium terreum]